MTTATPVDMRVREVRRSPDAGGGPLARRHVIVLEEVGGERRLPIWVGPVEATALALDLEDVTMPRPQTYRFAASLLAATGARIEEVRITRLHEGTFYAVVVVGEGAERPEVDARPSDALNLAVVTGAPVRVDTAVLDEAAAAADRHGWQDYEVAGAVIAAEVRSMLQEEQRRLAGEGTT